ncbi:MAG TPA: hypothetical protein VGE72_18105 [Azospirillum sp.]
MAGKGVRGILGTLRLVLALVVVLFHAGLPASGAETGVAAVAVFHTVSGFAMTGLLERHFATGRGGPVVAVLGALAVNAAVLAAKGELALAYNLELHLAAFVGAGAVALLGRMRPGRLDEALGAASYGCYLVHFAFIFIAGHLGITDALPFPAYVAVIAALSVLSGHATHLWIERPFAALCRALRAGWRTSRGGLRIPT